MQVNTIVTVFRRTAGGGSSLLAGWQYVQCIQMRIASFFPSLPLSFWLGPLQTWPPPPQCFSHHWSEGGEM
jgi:hypothetical protein